MNPDKSHGDTVGRVDANKVRFAPFNPYFYVPKYGSSDALPAPEVFFLLGCRRLNLLKVCYVRNTHTRVRSVTVSEGGVVIEVG